MAAFKDQLIDGVQSALDFLRSTKEAYEGANRFARMRVWILAVLALDLFATVMFVALTGGRAIDVDVWFQESFPSNMLILRNESDDPIEKVTLVLDGRYRLEVDTIAPGLRGFEVNREFRDAKDEAPDESYRPQRLEIHADGDEMIVPVGPKK